RLLVDAARGQPPGGLVQAEVVEHDVGGAATRARHGGMELLYLLVLRPEHDHAQALADEAVDDVQEAREPLAGALAGVRAEELPRVLHPEQARDPGGGIAGPLV